MYVVHLPVICLECVCLLNVCALSLAYPVSEVVACVYVLCTEWAVVGLLGVMV